MRVVILLCLSMFWTVSAYSQDLQVANPADAVERLHPPIPMDMLRARIAANIERLGIDIPQATADRGDFVRLAYPLVAAPNAEAFRTHYNVSYVDHNDTGPGFLRDFACGTRTYDNPSGYDHGGTDMMTSTFQEFDLERSWTHVIAAAPGVIVDMNDGATDRNSVRGYDATNANYVSIVQDDGIEAYYWHLANGSVLNAEIGDRVETGDYLGTVGSSGFSFEPHLHFELRHPDRFPRIVDPYGGACSDGSDTMWNHQHAYVDPAITGIFTHGEVPVRPIFGDEELTRFQRRFASGDEVHVSYFVRDQDEHTMAYAAILDPTGNEVDRFDFPGANPYYVDVWNNHAFSYALPETAMEGTWRIRAMFGGDIRERAFYVSREPEVGARLAAAILPGSRSVQSGSVATVFATVLNSSTSLAEGCWIGPGGPFDGQFRYRQTDPATNTALGGANVIFDVPAGGSRSFVMSFTPSASAVGESLDLPIRYKCDNSDAANIVSGVNTLLMSFGPQPVPDLIAIAITPSGDGILRIADENSAAAFATAVSNVGAAGTLTVRPQGLGTASTLRLRICETDTGTGACLAPATETISRAFGANETASFAVFGRAQGQAVVFAPATSRIRVVAEDATSVIRGSTSVAVRTN